MKTTLSILKADVGSIGGHTKPSVRMLDSVRSDAADAVKRGLLIDTFVGHTGDDICIVASHTKGENDTDVHQFAWNAFLNATDVARQYGLYGAGQDLLADAPSGNIRGAGPAVAEIEWDHDPVTTNRVRPAESFMVLAADKCGPGAYNLPLFLGFADPMYCAGLMLPRLIDGFTFNIIDMDNTGGDSLISLNARKTTTRSPYCSGTTSDSVSTASSPAIRAKRRRLSRPPGCTTSPVHIPERTTR